MPSADLPELKAAAAYTDHRARHVPLLSAFERALKILDELFQRIEREMYGSLAYKAFDKKLADAAVAVSRALSQAGAVHARLLEQEAAAADSMSEADKIKFMLAAMKTKPASVRQAFIAELASVP